MATKTEIKAAIQAQLTLNAGLTTHAQHEEFLHTEVDSILESIYPTETIESESSNTITVDNANINYDVKIVKIGRQVTITGSFSNQASTNLSYPILFEINPASTSYLPSTTAISGGISSISSYGNAVLGDSIIQSDASSIFILTNNQVKLNSALGIGEIGSFSITYNTLN